MVRCAQVEEDGKVCTSGEMVRSAQVEGDGEVCTVV